MQIDVLLSWGATRFASVEIEEAPRAVGTSNYNFIKLIKVSLLVLTNYTTISLRLASIMGFLFTIIGFFVLVYVLVVYFTLGSIPGFSFLVSAVSIFSGVQLFAMGIFGEYLARVFERSVDRPAYVVHEQIGGGMRMNVVILQPSYIPWRGYFDEIRRADLFVFYDDVQYDKRGWRNRNQIKTPRRETMADHPRLQPGRKTATCSHQSDPYRRSGKPWSEDHLKALRFPTAKRRISKIIFRCLE